MIKNPVLYQKIFVKKKLSNKEFKLYQYFHEITSVSPENIILQNNFIFFLVKKEDYFKAKIFLKKLRRQLKPKKIMIIRAESTLINFLFSLFPDVYIHDIKHKKDNTIIIHFIIYEERGIAIGKDGAYIKSVNAIFEKYIAPIKIKCVFLDINEKKEYF